MEHISQIDNVELNILYGAFVNCDSTWVCKNVISPYSRIYYVTGGEGFLTYGEKIITLRPGCLYFIPTGLKFDYKCENKLEKYFFHINLFSNDYIDVFSKCNDIISFKTNKIQLWHDFFAQEGAVPIMLLKSYIYEDLHEISIRAGIKSLGTKYSELIQNALLYINEHLSIKLHINEIADALHIAPSTLSKHFRDEIGMSIGHYIDSRIQFEAEKLLSNGDMPIELIGEKLGFCDRFYFTRKFKESANITPAKYRKAAENRKKI